MGIIKSNSINPFPSKGFPIDEENRLALDRVKSISALSAHSEVKGLMVSITRNIFSYFALFSRFGVHLFQTVNYLKFPLT